MLTIRKHFFTNDQNNSPIEKSGIKLVYNTDTIFKNVNSNYDSALMSLNYQFAVIELENTDEETKKYLKTLLISDFVHAIFSFQFLGTTLGCSTHDQSIANWAELPLRKCFDMGNNNVTPVWCSDREIFFSRLIDSLLGLKSEIISIKGVHSFSVVHFHSGDYVFNPTDPIVLINKDENKLISYEQLRKKRFRSIEVFRTKRNFGNANFLISNVLLKKIINNDLSMRLLALCCL